jgi:3-hydroxyisobutyrate dehydrogenase-like beta-hydroxyacid dehydrogenase
MLAEPGFTTRCGFIGLGSQGAPMARRMILAGYPVTLWARRAETLDPYRDTPAEYAATVAELGARAEHVGICVVNDADVQQVCDELFPAMRPGSRVAIHSTIHPQTCQALLRQAGDHGLLLIDAPVSGGSPAAEVGALTVMVGGEAEAIAAAKPIFETFAKLIVPLGEVGAGQNAKLINNALLTANMALAQSALDAGRLLGVEREALVDLLKASSGRSFGLEITARMPSPGSFVHGAKLLEKDLYLLGAVLGEGDPVFQAIADAATPFLDRVRNDAG